MAEKHPIASTMTIQEMPDSEIAQVLAGLLGTSVTSAERIYGGRNNRLYQLTCGDSKRYVAKFYPRVGPNDRDRLTAEFTSLDFLWKHGLKCVPEPVLMDNTHGCAIYEHVDGQEIPSTSVNESEIDQAARCLISIKELCGAEGSADLPVAAEACFSVQEVLENIEMRLARLQELPAVGGYHPDLRDFLDREYAPALAEIREWSGSTLEDWGMSPQHELAQSERTLSPSDFGFHNALRRPNGEIVFLDFEYFGWDDPAKMISDFLLHPGMAFGDHLKHRFVTTILEGFQGYSNLAGRLAVAYPLFGLKWCIIILNEFLPEKLSRREFANGVTVDLGETHLNQLKKARALLDRVMEQYARFPYAA